MNNVETLHTTFGLLYCSYNVRCLTSGYISIGYGDVLGVHPHMKASIDSFSCIKRTLAVASSRDKGYSLTTIRSLPLRVHNSMDLIHSTFWA